MRIKHPKSIAHRHAETTRILIKRYRQNIFPRFSRFPCFVRHLSHARTRFLYHSFFFSLKMSDAYPLIANFRRFSLSTSGQRGISKMKKNTTNLEQEQRG